jgi:hypothetical protein
MGLPWWSFTHRRHPDRLFFLIHRVLFQLPLYPKRLLQLLLQLLQMLAGRYEVLLYAIPGG